MDGRPDQTLLLQDQPMKKIIGKLIFIGGTRREGSLCWIYISGFQLWQTISTANCKDDGEIHES